MNHGSCDIVTKFWKLSAVNEREAPKGFGVEGALVGFVGFFFLVAVAFKGDFVFAPFVSALNTGVNLVSFSPVDAAVLEASKSGLVLGRSGPPIGRDPGLIVSKTSSTKLLNPSISWAPSNLLNSLPSL